MRLSEGTEIDRYTIEARLGEGGMAVVYRVRHNQLGSLHAMKVLKLPAAAIQERLLQEGRVQAQLNHPNIVSVTDVVDVHGSPGLVMEFIGGSSLDQFLRDRRLTRAQADDLGRGIIEGVAVAHQVGLIHRDLKPANILLGTTANGVVPKITDFGLAKMLDGEGEGEGHMATRTGLAMGTPAYMAPEQIESAKDVDQRADVFSLGVILYELMTGERPFQGNSTLAVLNAVAEGRRQPIGERMPDLPERFIRAIDGALTVDLDRRIPNCDALLDLWTGEERDARGGFSGIWDGDTVTRISRTVVPASGASLSDDSETYYPGLGETSLPTITAAPPAPAVATPDADAGTGGGALRIGAVLAVLVLVAGLAAARIVTRPAAEPTSHPTEVVPATPLGPEVVEADPPVAPELPETEAPKEPARISPPVEHPPVPEPGPVVDPEVEEGAEDVLEPEKESKELPAITFLSDPPGARVFVDGLEVGITPLGQYAVPKGRHRIKMILGDEEMEERISVGRRSARVYHWTRATGAFSER